MTRKFNLKRLSVIIVLIGFLSALGYIAFASAAEPSLEVSVSPSQSAILKPSSGPALGNLNVELIPKGETDQGVRQPIDVVFVFDVSGSMDEKVRGEKKIDSAKEALKEAVDYFKVNNHNGDKFALIPFSSEVGKSVDSYNNDGSFQPLTSDLNKIENFGQSLSAYGGTNYTQALEKANKLLKDSERNKYIIFLTDGEPTFSEAQEEVVTDKVFIRYERKCVTNYRYKWVGGWGGHWERVEYEECWNNPIYDETLETIEVFYRIVGNSAYAYYKKNGFEYNLGYSYAQIVNQIKQHGRDTATQIANNDIKLYSIGFGSKNDLDMPYLTELSSVTGGQAKNASTDDINTIFTEFSETIDRLQMTEVKLKVKLPANVGLQADANVTEDEDGYTVISLSDVPYEVGKGTPVLSEEDKLKSLPLTFSKTGEYTFDDMKLVYKDLEGNEITATSIEPIIINVHDKTAPIFNGIASFADPDKVTNLYKRRDEQNVEDNKNTFVVNYDLTPGGGNKTGTLTGIKIKQPLPDGVDLVGTEYSIETDANGQRIAVIPLNDVSYEGSDTDNLGIKETVINLPIEKSGANKYNGAEGITEIQVNSNKNWKLTIRTDENFEETTTVLVTYVDGTEKYLQLSPNNKFDDNNTGKQPKKITIFSKVENVEEKETTFTPSTLTAQIELQANWAMDQLLPPATVFYEDSNYQGTLSNTLIAPTEPIHLDVQLTETNSTGIVLYEGAADGNITKNKGNSLANLNETTAVTLSNKAVQDLRFIDNQAAIEVTYNDGSKDIIYLLPYVKIKKEDNSMIEVPYTNITETYKIDSDTARIGLNVNKLIPPFNGEVRYYLTQEGEAEVELTEASLYTSILDQQFTEFTVRASGGFAKENSVLRFIIEIDQIPITSISLGDSYTLAEGKTLNLFDKLEVNPSNTALNPQDLTWSSSDSSAVTVDSNGIVTAVKEGGYAVITVTYTKPDGEVITATTVIYVKVNKTIEGSDGRW
ncbi:VWA domain-containing protein [Bacillus tianshenii]|nr:VWA domain-containing protein [Bacillus tianshenii]